MTRIGASTELVGVGVIVHFGSKYEGSRRNLLQSIQAFALIGYAGFRWPRSP